MFKNNVFERNYLKVVLSDAMESGYHSKNGASLKSQMSKGNIVQRAFLIFVVFCVSVASTLAQALPGNIVQCPTNESIVVIDFEGGSNYRIYIKDVEIDRDKMSIKGRNYKFTIKNGRKQKLTIKDYSGWVQEVELDASDDILTFESSGRVVARGTSPFLRLKEVEDMNENYFKAEAKRLKKSLILINTKSGNKMYINGKEICKLKEEEEYFWIDNGSYDLKIDDSKVYKLEINNRYLELTYPINEIDIIKDRSLY